MTINVFRGMIVAFVSVFLVLLPHSLKSQPINGIINAYTPVNGIDPCGSKITVDSTNGFAVGDKVLLIQMKGAAVDESLSATFGDINAIGSAGLFEKAFIAGIVGNDIYFTKQLVNFYEPSGRVQMVSVPQFVNATVNAVLRPRPWDGSTGGIVVVECSGTLTVKQDINADFIGFRGGEHEDNCLNCCNSANTWDDEYYSTGDWKGAMKGESISETIAGKEAGKGKFAAGGGGGNDHNAGGAGGGNYGAGGNGGNNNDPGFFTCKGYHPGEGGLDLASYYSSGERLFLGSGGGSGHGNNGTGSPGSNGGGIIMLKAATLDVQDNRRIRAKSKDVNTIPPIANSDGAGGGGSGGVVILEVGTFTALPFTIQVYGGKGGDSKNNNSNRCHGPGGGGGGGVIFTGTTPLPGTVTVDVSGGLNGLSTQSTNGCNNTSNGAQPGTAGTVLSNFSAPAGTLDPVGSCLLPYSFLHVEGKTNTSGLAELSWDIENELGEAHYLIEKSHDGVLFEIIGEIQSIQREDIANYFFTDFSTLNRTTFYRIGISREDGGIQYSRKILLYPALESLTLEVYPNPVQTDGEGLKLQIQSPKESLCKMNIQTLSGVMVMESSFHLEEGEYQHEFDVSQLTPGIYLLKLSSQNIVIQRKIVRL